MAGKELKDAPIPNAVDKSAVEQRIVKNHDYEQFVRLGEELLKKTNQVNIITVAKFEPFLPLFNYDAAKADKNTGDPAYRKMLSDLMYRYQHDPNGPMVNLYQPTIVIVSEEDRREVAWLPQVFTRLNTEISPNSETMRDNIPAAMSRASTLTRDELIMEATLADVLRVNDTPERHKEFRRVREETALLQKAFVENNLSDEKRAEMMAKVKDTEGPSGAPSSSGDSLIVLDDDD